MKIVSFGDSFIWGSELTNNHDGSRAWPGLCAQKLGCEYATLAVPGCGNDNIARQIFQYFSNNPSTDTLAVINWTWMQRWDFYVSAADAWTTLGPTCVPVKLTQYWSQDQAAGVIDFYSQHAGNSILWNRWRNLQTISSVQNYLLAQGIVNIQTCMDSMLYDTKYHAPDYIQTLQQLTQPQMQSFEGVDFLTWSRQQGYTVTEPGWHPLEAAHLAAQDLWLDTYQQLLNK